MKKEMMRIVIGSSGDFGKPREEILVIPVNKIETFARDWISLRRQGYTWFSFLWAGQVCTVGKGKGVRDVCHAKCLGYWV